MAASFTSRGNHRSQGKTSGWPLPRVILYDRIDHCADAELDAVGKALLHFEAGRLLRELGGHAQADDDAGKPDPPLVEAAIPEHRARHAAPGDFIARHLSAV